MEFLSVPDQQDCMVDWGTVALEHPWLVAAPIRSIHQHRNRSYLQFSANGPAFWIGSSNYFTYLVLSPVFRTSASYCLIGVWLFGSDPSFVENVVQSPIGPTSITPIVLVSANSTTDKLLFREVQSHFLFDEESSFEGGHCWKGPAGPTGALASDRSDSIQVSPVDGAGNGVDDDSGGEVSFFSFLLVCVGLVFFNLQVNFGFFLGRDGS